MLIAKAMHNVVLLKAMYIILEVNYVVVNVDKVTIVNAQQWINIHIMWWKIGGMF